MRIRVYQLVGDFEGLNTQIPSSLKEEDDTSPKLTKLAAYYFAHAIKLKKFMIDKKEAIDYAAEGVLFRLTEDSVEKSEADTESAKIRYEMLYKFSQPIEEAYKELDSLPFHIGRFVHKFIGEILRHYEDYFDAHSDYRFLKPRGIEKLKQEWPQIWNELGLDEFVESTPRGIPI